MKMSGSFHKELEKDLKNPQFRILFEREKNRLRLTERLRQALQRSELSIRKVASGMGTSKSQVERMISDPELNLSIDSLIKFAAVMGKRIDIRLK